MQNRRKGYEPARSGVHSVYRKEYREIANVKIEEVHSKLLDQSQKLESAFMNDFVAEMNETIGEAKREIDAINRELKQIPFGQDTYKLRCRKTGAITVFRICKNWRIT